MSFHIRFGTDGWRGVIAEDYTFDNVRRAAQGFASYLLKQGKRDEWVVIGYDKRFQSENFALAAAEVLTGNGLRVYLTQEATPTPVIAYAVVHQRACGAINITASHNPPTDNGFKVRDEHGGAIPPQGLKEIESLIPPEVQAVKRLPANEAEAQGRLVRFDAAPAYIEHIQTLIDLEPLRQAGLTLLVDPMWGNGAGWFPRLLGGGKTRIIEIHNVRNPIFPEMKRPEPIPPNINIGLQATREHAADALLITDGDADRFGLGDEHGQFVNQLRVYALLAYYLLEVRGERGPIVKTLSTTTMLNRLGEMYGVPVYETGVGFKYVAPKMLEVNALIGGEESGGYAFRNHVPERDGILAGLYLLDFMVRTGRRPSQLLELLFQKLGQEYFYDRVDSPFSGDRAAREQRILQANPQTIGGLRVTGLSTLDGFQFHLEDGGWMLIRFSGTEPILRVYCETTHREKVQAILEDGLRIAGVK
uniref:Phosphoglucomutase n=1 Tax=uncultured Chloroflexota bacterium TaxID=166587 RepID=H5SAM8_9CHLR|nr:phosphoglucomutase [uncultured Chloroflexota bacterium]BAL54772.1 phosphoglucomutase [uncultured Chloroflexota bacterium]